MKTKKASGSLLQQAAWEYGHDIRAIRGGVAMLEKIEVRVGIDIRKDFNVDYKILGSALEGIASEKKKRKRGALI